MNKVLLRRLGVVLGAGLLLGAIVLGNVMSYMKEAPPRRPSFQPVKVIDTMHVRNEVIPTTLEVQGELVAYDKIDIFAEVSGTLAETERPFKVGSFFPKGSVLIEVDAEEAKLNLLSQKSNLLNAITQLMPDLKIDYPESFAQWKRYLDQYDVEKPLAAFPEPLNDQEKFFIAARNLHSQFYTIKSAEERLGKYVLYTPFSGVITQININPGALVRAGQPLGVLMNTGNYELEATVALGDLKYIQPGNPVQLVSEDIEGRWTGRVKRINDQVDPGTQTVKVFISVNGPNLREGMYLRGEIDASEIENAIAIPRDMLQNQQFVYVLQDSTLKLQEVNVLKLTEDRAIVRGLSEGAPLLKNMIPGLYDGVKVQVRTGQSAESVSTGALSSAAQ
jgi:multidrug efflux pump subunit AcrA (membrane-fusion protein)